MKFSRVLKSIVAAALCLAPISACGPEKRDPKEPAESMSLSTTIVPRRPWTGSTTTTAAPITTTTVAPGSVQLGIIGTAPKAGAFVAATTDCMPGLISPGRAIDQIGNIPRFYAWVPLAQMSTYPCGKWIFVNRPASTYGPVYAIVVGYIHPDEQDARIRNVTVRLSPAIMGGHYRLGGVTYPAKDFEYHALNEAPPPGPWYTKG